MEIILKALKFMLLSGLWWMSDQAALASSPFPLCEWSFSQKPGENDNTANHSLQVNCSGLGLTSVPSGLLSQITALDLSYNITEIKWFEFSHHSHYIAQLILSHNSLEKIDDGALSSLLGLKELNLSKNSLAVVTEEMFQGLRDLKMLDLRHNQLQWIHEMAFTDLENLEVLWLQNNNLHAVPDAVNMLTGLKALSLASNRLSQLLTGDLRHCTDLKILQLEDNQISTVAAGAFQKKDNLRTIDLSSNQLEELDDTMVKFLWERRVNLRLHGNPLRCDCASGQTGKGAVWLTDAVQCQGIGTFGSLRRELLQGLRAPLKVHTTVTVPGVPGQSLMLTCKNSYHEGTIMYWRTPIEWLMSQNSCNSHSDMKCLCNGNLTIVNLTCQHSGLYYCFQENKHERVILPYRVQALGTCLNPMPKSRVPREVKVHEDTVSDSDFAAAVTSSVLVTFLVGLALGAFSRSHLITCLQRAKLRLRRKGVGSRRTSVDNADEISMETSPSGFTSFGNGMPSDEDAPDAPNTTPSPPAKAPRSFRSKREQPEDGMRSGGCDSEDGSNSAAPARTEQEPSETDLQPKGSLPPRPARRSRVIKLYNYDEDGQHYGHIKEQEGGTGRAPQPKQRTKSLNRLSAIMSSVETPDLSLPTPMQTPDPESELGNSSQEEGSISSKLHFQLES